MKTLSKFLTHQWYKPFSQQIFGLVKVGKAQELLDTLTIDHETEAYKWNLAIVHFINYTCVLPFVTC